MIARLGEHPRLLVARAAAPQWSGDGRRLFYAKDVGNGSCDHLAFFAADRDGSHRRRLGAQSGIVSSRGLVASTTKQGIWVSTLAGSHRRLLVPKRRAAPRSDYLLEPRAWSPDGGKLVYGFGEEPVNNAALDTGRCGLVLPDGRFAAFPPFGPSDHGGAYPILARRATWSPDSRTIALDGVNGIWVFDLKRRLIPAPRSWASEAMNPTFSPDSKWLAYKTPEPGIVIRRLDSSGSRRLLRTRSSSDVGTLYRWLP